MRKMITCSFDEVGVRITAWNGIHPDRVGSFSTTVEINRTRFNEACQNKIIFGELLSINIAEGWQNALSDAVKNASPLKIDFLSASKVIVEKITERFVLEHGEEEGMKKAEAFFNSVDMETEETEELIKKAMVAVAEKSEETGLTGASSEQELILQNESIPANVESTPQITEEVKNERSGNDGAGNKKSANGSKKSRSKTSA